MNKDLKQGSGVKSEISPNDGKPIVSRMLHFMTAVGMCINFKEWCDEHAWEEDYREQKTHTTAQLFDIWYSRVFSNFG